MKADRVETNLYWRHGDTAQFRIKLPGPEGRELWESFGRISKDVARQLTRKRRHELLDRWALEKHGLLQPAREPSKFAELFIAYEEWALGADIKDATVRHNIHCLRRILREVHSDSFDVDAARLDLLTPRLLLDYESTRIAAAKQATKQIDTEGAERAIESAQTTVYSKVHQARSLFNRRARASTPYRQLVFPVTMDAFMNQPISGSTTRDYQRPSAAIILAVKTGIEGLRTTRPELWLAAMVEANTGARRGSAANAKWEWFVDEGEIDLATNQPVVTFWVQRAKGARSGVTVFRSMYDEMLAARVDAGPYIVPGATEEHRHAVFAELVGLLRTWGLNRRQPNHELRKLFVDTKRKLHGTGEAQAAAGHSDSRLLRHYSENKSIHPVRMV